jgi:hypothetical protein
MSSAIDKLNMKPGEKRLLVGILILLFGVVNFMFVFPQFGEIGRIRSEIQEIQYTVERYDGIIAKKGMYDEKLTELQGQGSQVILGEQALQLQMTVQSQALQSGVTINRYSPVNRSSSATNAFFNEKSIVVTYDAGYEPLINFLVRLAEHESRIRVRSMDIKPDRTRQRLQGSITLVASYQKGGTTSPAKPKTNSTAPTK